MNARDVQINIHSSGIVVHYVKQSPVKKKKNDSFSRNANLTNTTPAFYGADNSIFSQTCSKPPQ